VWPEPASHEHAGRLELWVGRADISKAKPPPWPLLRAGQADIFEPQPFGTDVRGRAVKAPMAYLNWLIGAIPRQGKTAAARVLTCTAALDPAAELWIAELKGSGDLDPLEQCSHRFVSGIDDASIAYAAESLKLLKAEIARRTERLKALPREVCPDKRVTREIAKRRSLKVWPIVCVVDEAQNLFGHEKYGKQAGEDAMELVIAVAASAVLLGALAVAAAMWLTRRNSQRDAEVAEMLTARREQLAAQARASRPLLPAQPAAIENHTHTHYHWHAAPDSPARIVIPGIAEDAITERNEP